MKTHIWNDHILLAAFCLMAFGVLFVSCSKDSFITSPDAQLYTSADTIAFDTVFTTIGSVTKSFKIFNDNDQKLLLSKVALSGGASSSFHLNIDGVSSNQVENIELKANDSMYVFVQVNIDPNAENKPFVIRDSIEIAFNGKKRFVQLQAYGQNAVFLNKKIIRGIENWTSALPYVILGSLQVDTNALLNIEAGTKIYLHANAPFLVDGTLSALGSNDARILFSGDRMDEVYKDLPASWPGIYFRNTSENNVMEYAIIKNAYQGIIAQERSTTSNPKLTLSKCIVDNIYDAGILGINTEIYADNCLISNCGSNLMLAYGGDYQFTFCTVVTYGNSFINHKNPVLQLSDFISSNGINYTAPLKAIFTNSIFWGENGIVENEISVMKKGSNLFDVKFDHVLYKAKDEVSNATFNASIKNINPGFDSVNTSRKIYDFRLSKNPGSPALNSGVPTSFLYDLNGKLRDATPDIGCYEN
ncbi:MAG: hypothetical protein ABIN48_13670 [Ginsengibacter sp.]